MGAINWNAYIEAAEAAGEGVSDFTPLPEGSYDVKVLKAEVKKTKAGDKDMIVPTFVVEGGPHAGRRLWSNLVVTTDNPKAMGLLIRRLTALGVRPLLDSGASLEQIAAGLTGALATVKVKVGEWAGKPKNDVTDISARQGGLAGPNLTQVPAPQGPAGLPI